jgi:hypothetical protein
MNPRFVGREGDELFDERIRATRVAVRGHASDLPAETCVDAEDLRDLGTKDTDRVQCRDAVELVAKRPPPQRNTLLELPSPNPSAVIAVASSKPEVMYAE